MEKEKQFCKSCRAELTDEHRFCIQCGTKVEVSGSQSKTSHKKPIYKQWWLWVAIAVVLAAIVLVVCLTGGGDKVTIETLMELETMEDVIERFGAAKSSYDVVFMGRDVTMGISYGVNQEVFSIGMSYRFPGVNKIIETKVGNELQEALVTYQPSQKDLNNLDKFLDELIDTFTEEYGRPKTSDSPIMNQYGWTAGKYDIVVTDFTPDHELTHTHQRIAIDIRSH